MIVNNTECRMKADVTKIYEQVAGGQSMLLCSNEAFIITENSVN